MILVDFEIKHFVDQLNLIGNFKESGLRNCRYNLRAGRAFASGTGDEIIVEQTGTQESQKIWKIEPSETLMILTAESLQMPDDCMASYGQLHRLARQGLLLVNSSIVEPGYQGALSCYFVNMSNNTITLCPGDEIAKLCFHKLSSKIGNFVPEVIELPEYIKSLSKHAAQYPHSFLNIGGLEKRVTAQVMSGMNASLVQAAGVILILVLVETLQPLFGRFFGIDTTKEEVLQLQSSVDKARESISTVDLVEKNKILNERLSKIEKMLKVPTH